LILTDREIKNSLGNGLIEITPAPPADAYSSTSVDLTLDSAIRIFKDGQHGAAIVFDPGMPGYQITKLLNEWTEPYDIGDGGYDLQPNKLLLGWTRERVALKAHGRVAARVEGKSSLARVGLAVHVTAPVIHAGFEGTIQLEFINHGPFPIRLHAGKSVCQLVFEQTLGMPESAYKGQFFGQTAK
jgi:dCTP deaminase